MNEDLTTACIILILAEACPNLKDDVDASKLAHLWHSAYEVLDYLKAQHPTAGQCSTALKDLRARALVFQRSDESTNNAIHQNETTSPRSFDPNAPPAISSTVESGAFHQGETISPSSLGLSEPSTISHPFDTGSTTDFGDFLMPQPQRQNAPIDIDENMLHDFGNQDGIFIPMIHGLESPFGGARDPDGIWGGFDPTWTWTSL